MPPTLPLVPLPFDPTPPTREDVTASAAASPLLASIDRFRQHVGDGLLLAAGGRLTLAGADACGILGMDETHGGRPVNPVARLRLLVAVAME